jgi:hypothetical protein
MILSLSFALDEKTRVVASCSRWLEPGSLKTFNATSKIRLRCYAGVLK